MARNFRSSFREGKEGRGGLLQITTERQNYNKEEEMRVFWHIVACFPRMTQRVPSVGLWDFITCAVSQT